MTFKTSNSIPVVAAMALTLIGCGGTSAKPSTTQTVTASAGATLTAGAATLTIPAGALKSNTQVTLREADPKHTGRADRVEIEPHDALNVGPGLEAHLSVKVSDSNPKVKMHSGSDDSLEDVEVDDRNHHSFKTNMTTLGDVEVEVEHGASCAALSVACTATQECDDGACKDHNDAAKTCAAVCDTGQECDDGICRTHVEVETEHGTPDPHACSPTCDAGFVCNDGLCSVVHG